MPLPLQNTVELPGLSPGPYQDFSFLQKKHIKNSLVFFFLWVFAGEGGSNPLTPLDMALLSRIYLLLK